MQLDNVLGPLKSHPSAAAAVVGLLDDASRCTEPDVFLDRSLPTLLRAMGGDFLTLARAEQGDWRVIAGAGIEHPLPAELLSDVLDADAAAGSDGWWAAPLAERSELGEVLALHCTDENSKDLDQSIGTMASLLHRALSTVRDRHRQARRIQRLEAILQIVAQWNQTHETEALLEQMAQTSTRLLGAERASIFLWDRPNKTLVGRPALGVEGGELRIADDKGVVGQVVQSGQPRRVDQHHDQQEIDRHVDKQLGYKTKTLLCVPMRGQSGELFGAFEMINKLGGNFSEEDQAALTELAAFAAVSLEKTQQYEQLLSARRQMADQAAQRVQLFGDSPVIKALQSTVQRVADTELAVLILGENGTGKEVVAQRIHYSSHRRNEPFVAVNCAAISETLLESELFGHEKGAFTDAHETRAGKFEAASGGTLFLDEIGEMSPGGQAKLLRVLEEKLVVRVVGSTPIHTDSRVLAATNQNLAQMVRQKKFREDLYFRLNVVTLELPALRERGDDILLLAEHFLRDFCSKARRRLPKFTAAARKRLLAHAWPGNVRELRNVMERLAYLSQGERIDADDLAFSVSPTDDTATLVATDRPLSQATDDFQVQYIKKHIEMAGNNMSDAAKRLGLHRSNLYRKMRQLGMSTENH